MTPLVMPTLAALVRERMPSGESTTPVGTGVPLGSTANWPPRRTCGGSVGLRSKTSDGSPTLSTGAGEMDQATLSTGGGSEAEASRPEPPHAGSAIPPVPAAAAAAARRN